MQPQKQVQEERDNLSDLSGKEIHLVVFKLADEEYAIEIHQAKEIINLQSITKIPNAPESVSGIINLRGKIIVIVDLRKRLSLEAAESRHILIVEMNEQSLGIIVDSIVEIIKVDEKLIKKAPAILASKIHIDYLNGVAVLGKRLIILLELSKIMDEKELLKLLKHKT